MSYQKPPKKKLFQHLMLNIKDSHNGLKIMFRESSTFRRIYPMMLICGLLLGIVFDFIALEYIILAAIFIIDVITETMNTAVEEACDSVTRDFSEYIKRSKDIASAAVYIAHLSYIVSALFFTISHIICFDWWTKLIPA